MANGAAAVAVGTQRPEVIVTWVPATARLGELASNAAAVVVRTQDHGGFSASHPTVACFLGLAVIAFAGFLAAFELQACVVALATSAWTDALSNRNSSMASLLAAPRGGEQHQPHYGLVAAAARRARLRVVVDGLSGACFGAALICSGMADPARVASFLDWSKGAVAWDPAMGLVMASAIGVAAPLMLRWSRAFEASPMEEAGHHASMVTSTEPPLVALLPPKPYFAEAFSMPRLAGARPDARLVSGSLLFGAGWGLAGLCPGPALVNLGAAVTVLAASLRKHAGGPAGALWSAGPVLVFNVALFMGFALNNRYALFCRPQLPADKGGLGYACDLPHMRAGGALTLGRPLAR